MIYTVNSTEALLQLQDEILNTAKGTIDRVKETLKRSNKILYTTNEILKRTNTITCFKFKDCKKESVNSFV